MLTTGRVRSLGCCPKLPKDQDWTSSLLTSGPGTVTPAARNDSCSQDLNAGVKPGFPKTIQTNDTGVRQAARHSAERFNNCTNDLFLFKEARVLRALVQIVKGLKYMLELEIRRTTCKKTRHSDLDDCDFQTNHTLKWISAPLHGRKLAVSVDGRRP
ncbi:Cystatin-F [Tupaia chinensis]|uniref:Cystatin-F n=1 Tax=Tupaia chinensis TaxID=246437 RepID=L8Y964_TUPCH|nr:Cystatin-F [Tupaia chinensis]